MENIFEHSFTFSTTFCPMIFFIFILPSDESDGGGRSGQLCRRTRRFLPSKCSRRPPLDPSSEFQPENPDSQLLICGIAGVKSMDWLVGYMRADLMDLLRFSWSLGF